MRVWITRTRPGADRTAERVRALGHEPWVEPVLEICSLPAGLEMAGVDALAFTSINAVEAFAATMPDRELPVFTVGSATAAAARQAGFRTVRSADGDVDDLARLIASAAPGSTVLHAAGRPRAGDLQSNLAELGVQARTAEIYESRRRAHIEAPRAIDAVLAHSPHAARILADMEDLDRDLPMFGLSEAVAAPLRCAGFRNVTAAERPSEAALLHRLSTGLGATPERR